MLTQLRVGIPGAAGDHAVVYLPREWVGDGTRLGVVLAAGSNTGWEGAYSPNVLLRIAHSVTDAGYAVVTSELGGDQFGNVNCQVRITALADLLSTLGARSDKIALAGFSQGAGNVLAWAGNNSGRVHSVTGWAPLVDLEIVAGNPDLDAAYPGGWSEAVYGAVSNPVTMAAAGNYEGVPITVCYSSNDPVIPVEKVTGFAAVADAVVVDLGAVGHDNSVPNRPAAVAALLHQLGGIDA